MAVYPICQHKECSSKRRDKCLLQAAHKRFVGWVADWKPSRKKEDRRRREIFGYDLKNPKECADECFSAWKTDFKRDKRGFSNEQETTVITFEQVADEWWTKVVVGKDHLKNPRREENRVNMLKLAFGPKLLALKVPENKIEREQYLTLDTIDAWVVKRRQASSRAGSINRDIKPVKWILDFAVEHKYISENPMKRFKRIKGERIHDRWMTQEEVDSLVAAAYDLQDEDLVHFISIGVNTGFRLGNLLRLTARDIHWTTSKDEIERGVFGLIEARQTKSDTPYTVPITQAIESLLRRLCQQRPTGPLLKCGQISQRFRDAARAKKAGLYKDKDDNDRVTIHTLRHTFGVLYLKRGGDIYKLSKLLGHASVAITDKIYARFCPKDKEAQAPMMSTPIAGIEQPKFNVV